VKKWSSAVDRNQNATLRGATENVQLQFLPVSAPHLKAKEVLGTGFLRITCHAREYGDRNDRIQTAVFFMSNN